MKLLQELVIGDSIIEWLSLATLIGGFSSLLYAHNCHVHGCYRLAWHPHPEHGHPVCRKHSPDHPSGGGHTITENGEIL